MHRISKTLKAMSITHPTNNQNAKMESRKDKIIIETIRGNAKATHLKLVLTQNVYHGTKGEDPHNQKLTE